MMTGMGIPTLRGYTILLLSVLAVDIAADVGKVELDVTKLLGIEETCRQNEALYIEDIQLELNNDCTVNSSSLYSEPKLKDFIKRDCTGKTKCRLNDFLGYLDQFLCKPNLRPVAKIKLNYHCKLFEFTPKQVFNMSSKVTHQNPAANATLFLVMKSAPHCRSRLCSVTSQAPVTMRLLQVDFGEHQDLPRQFACHGLLEITNIHKNTTNSTSYQWNSTVTYSVTFTDTYFEINVMMSRRLVKIEMNATQSVYIKCRKGKLDRECATDDDSDSASERPPNRDDVIIIVLGLIASLATLTVICMCALFVCRVHEHCGTLPKWLTTTLRALAVPIKTDKNLNYTDTDKLVNQDSPSPTSDTHYHNNIIIDMTNSPSISRPSNTDNSQNNEPSPQNLNSLNAVKPSSKYESIRRTSLPLLKADSMPYLNIQAKNDVKIFGSQFTLNKPQTPEIIQLSPSANTKWFSPSSSKESSPQTPGIVQLSSSANTKLLSSASSSSKGSAPQTPEIIQLSPSEYARLLSSEPSSRKGSPTPGSKMGSPKFLAELNALLPMQNLAASNQSLKDEVVEYTNSPALTPSVYSLASHNSNEKIPIDHESLYSNDETERGDYSHLNPFGNRKKILHNVYDG